MDRWHSGNQPQFSSSGNNPSFLRSGVDSFTTRYFTNNKVSAVCYNGKRKASSQGESSFHPKTKQLITEARIASSMQRLNLDNDTYVTSSRNCDEGFFEDDFKTNNDSDDEEPELDEESNKPSILPRFIISPDIKEKLKEKEDSSILPKNIFDAINQPCMAVIPYTPPLVTTTLECHKDTDEKNNARQQSNLPNSSKSGMEVLNSTPDYEMVVDEDMGV